MEKTALELQQEVVKLRQEILTLHEKALKQAKKITRFYFIISLVSVLILFALVILTNHHPITQYKTIFYIAIVIGIFVAMGTATMFSVWYEKKNGHIIDVNYAKWYLREAKEELTRICEKK